MNVDYRMGGDAIAEARVFNKTRVEVEARRFVEPGEGGGGTEGAFFTIYVDDAGDTYLLGGSVTGGNGGSVSIPDYKIIDADTGPEQVAGTILYILADCSATVEDGLMLPGCLLNDADWDLVGGSNHTFTVVADTGNIYYEIGRWTATSFLPAGVGSLLASGCIGNFALARV